MSREDDISRLLPYLYSREQAAATARAIADFVGARIREAMGHGRYGHCGSRECTHYDDACHCGCGPCLIRRTEDGRPVPPEPAPVQPEATAGAEVWSVFDTGPDWDESVYRSGAHCDMCDQTAVSFLCARHRGMLAVRGPAPVGAEAPVRVTLSRDVLGNLQATAPGFVSSEPTEYVRADVYEKAVDALRALVWLVRTDIDDGFPVPRELTQAESFLRAHDAASTRK